MPCKTYDEGNLTNARGGTLSLNYYGEVKVKLKARSRSVTNAVTWSVELDDKYVMIEARPDGLTFRKPVVLRIKARNVDLSEVDLKTLDYTGSMDLVSGHSLNLLG